MGWGLPNQRAVQVLCLCGGLLCFIPQLLAPYHIKSSRIQIRLRGWTQAWGLLRTQVALFDRVHSMRVKAIQEEYQRYMERVRTKAQTAIDQANAQYQHSRTMLTARVDALVHFLQNRHAQVCTGDP